MKTKNSSYVFVQNKPCLVLFRINKTPHDIMGIMTRITNVAIFFNYSI